MCGGCFLKILANDWRLMILCELLKGERSVANSRKLSALVNRLCRSTLQDCGAAIS